MAPRSIIAARLRAAVPMRSISSRRFYSDKAPSPTSKFYKTFTRPVAKVLLMAVFTYQVLYWSWVKLETEDVRAQKDATIKELEGKVEEYKKKIAEEVQSKKA